MRSVCPLDYRYGSEEMRSLLSRDSIIKKMAEVEAAAMKGLAAAGLAPPECADVLSRCSRLVTPEDVDRLEREIKHETAALAKALALKCGECGSYVHLGLTSSDVIDTAWALIIREALRIIKSRLRSVIELLLRMSADFRDVVMVGRTHGRHALPITFGFKLANYAYELVRSYERLCGVEERVVRGKLSGAVGTMAAWGGAGFKVESETLSTLSLEPHPISTQVAPRDGYAELASALAILASQLDRLALEVRELVRDEIGELEIKAGFSGSSTMPHKVNPVLAERVSGIARLCRGLAVSALENVVLMHERDLSNSSCERVLIPHILLLTDQALIDTLTYLKGVRVRADAMARNLLRSGGWELSECVMIKLVLKTGMPRHKAHEVLEKLARTAGSKGVGLREALESSGVADLLSSEDLDECLDPRKYLGMYSELIDRAATYVRERLGRC